MRPLGGFIGHTPAPSRTSAPGVWDIRSQARYAQASVWPTVIDDQSYANVSLLLHMDGANGSTTFTDASSSPVTVTRVGATISTTQSRFGGASGSFSNGQYLQCPLSVAQFGTADFTIEGWIYPTSRTQEFPTVFANYNSFSTGVVALFAGAGPSNSTKYQLSYNNTFPGIVSADSIAYNTWTHYAAVRSAGTLSLYLNGVSQGSANVTASLNGNGSFYINAAGDNPSGTGCNGFHDEVRITKGVARYTANFTPPSSAFPP